MPRRQSPARHPSWRIQRLVYLFFSILAGSAVLNDSADAGIILQDQRRGTINISASSPLGQTFTAEDQNIESIAFSFSDSNNSSSNGLTSMSLFEGVGNSGLLLHTATQVLTPGLGLSGLPEFVDFDFTSVTLVVGNIYTAIVQRPNSRWAVERNFHSGSSGPIPGSIDYAGGDIIVGGSVSTNQDLRFRVTPAAAIPLPGTLLLLAPGLAGLAFLGRRQRGPTQSKAL